MEHLHPLSCDEAYNNLTNLSGPGLDYTLADTGTVIAGSLVFVLVLPFVLFDFRIFPLGTTPAVLLGAFLMVATSVLSQQEAYRILGETANLRTIFLLLGMMLLAQYFERENILEGLLQRILRSDMSFPNYLWRISLLTSVLSAFFTNDAACVVLTPLLLNHWQSQKRPVLELETLLLCIATSANIGSVITIFGNPQMALIASRTDTPIFEKSRLDLLKSLTLLGPPAVLGSICNLFFLIAHFKIRAYRLRKKKMDKTAENALFLSNVADEKNLLLGDNTLKESPKTSVAGKQGKDIQDNLSRVFVKNTNTILNLPKTEISLSNPHLTVVQLDRRHSRSLSDLEGHRSHLSSKFHTSLDRTSSCFHSLSELETNQSEQTKHTTQTGLARPATSASGGPMPEESSGPCKTPYKHLQVAAFNADLFCSMSKLNENQKSRSQVSLTRTQKYCHSLSDLGTTHSPADTSQESKICIQGRPCSNRVKVPIKTKYVPLSENEAQILSQENKIRPFQEDAPPSSVAYLSAKRKRRYSSTESLVSAGVVVSERYGIYRSLVGLGDIQSLPLSHGSQGPDIPSARQQDFNEFTPTGSRPFCVFLCCSLCVVLGLFFVQTDAVRFDMGLLPMAAAVVVMVVDAAWNKKSALVIMKRLDWSVIMMFFGIFIWMDGVNATRIPRWIWKNLGLSGRPITDVTSVLIFSVFVIVCSNIFSNVPLTIILLEQLEPCTKQLNLVLYLAWCSTIAGNLTLFGSVANLIVAQKAKDTVKYPLTFWAYLKYGFITTLVIVYVGIPVIHGLLRTV